MARQITLTHVQGIVTAFKGNGRKFGYPTANLTTTVALADGVYFGFADLDIYAHHQAMIFIGTPVTVGDTQRRVEAYLLDIADQDYYGQSLNLQVCKFHRPNQMFDSVDELLVAMKADEIHARQWFMEQ
jgi:FAD synthase